MDDFFEKSLLYDFYSELLTEKQKLFFTSYYFDNLSLSEIGEKYNLTPQGVRDLLKRTEKILANYESKLELLEKHIKMENSIKNIVNIINNTNVLSENSKNKLVNMVCDILE